MSTQKKIEANRKNAQKSTGPKSAAGKAIVAQNATKHGLTAQYALIPGEDPAEFDLHRDEMLTELDPQGPLETVLAHRIVTLTWQLNRAPRLETAAFNYRMDNLSFKPEDPQLHLGETLVWDFANDRTLEKIQNYTARIESNLYKTLTKFQQLQQIRQNATNTQPVSPRTEMQRVSPPHDQSLQNKANFPHTESPSHSESRTNSLLAAAPPKNWRGKNKPNPLACPVIPNATPCHPESQRAAKGYVDSSSRCNRDSTSIVNRQSKIVNPNPVPMLTPKPPKTDHPDTR